MANKKKKKKKKRSDNIKIKPIHIFAASTLILLVIFAYQTLLPMLIDAFSENEESYAVIMDDADLLTDEEEAMVLEVMEENLPYGNMLFLTADKYVSSTTDYAESVFLNEFGFTDGSYFFIDMYNREIYMASRGGTRARLNKEQCLEITDRVYTYAGDGEYMMCAKEAFALAHVSFEKGVIMPGMKLIVSVLLAALSALIINIFILYYSRHAGFAGNKPDRFTDYCKVNTTSHKETIKFKWYSPDFGVILLGLLAILGSGSSHSGGGHSGGSHSGGGHSGRSGGFSGGGHKF